MKNSIRVFFLSAVTLLSGGFARGEDLCGLIQGAWNRLAGYQCTYRSVTGYEGKKSESLMLYSFQKPGKVRMDIQKPKDGAVLIYNPDISDKVKVRPFPKMKFFVLNYSLTDKRVTSDSGGTIDRSHLGGRIDSFCADLARLDEKEKADLAEKFSAQKMEKIVELPHSENGKKIIRRWSWGEDLLPRAIQVLNAKGEVLESFEWLNLKCNPKFGSKQFEKF